MGGAVVLLLSALVLLSNLTAPPEQIAAPESTTTTVDDRVLPPTTTTTIDFATFTVDDIATGDGFVWIRAQQLGRFWPVGLVEHEGIAYLFGSADDPAASLPVGGITAWMSPDGVNWSRLGEVIPEGEVIQRVVSTTMGLVALGTEVGSEGSPVVWVSPDGVDWRRHPLPTVEEDVGGGSLRLRDAEVHDGRLFVVGTMLLDSTQQVIRALPPDLVGPRASSVRLGFELRADVDDGIVQVYGPLGLHAFSLRLDSLGLDAATESSLFGPTPPARQYLWSSADRSDWQVEALGPSTIDDLWARPDGALVAHASGGRGTTISVFTEHGGWTRHGISGRAWIFQIGARAVWGDLLVGAGLGEELFQSSSGLEWRHMGTGEVLPDGINWALGPVDAGESGVMAVAAALGPGSPGFTPVTIDAGESELTLDLEAARLQIASPGREPTTIPLWATGMADLYTVDFTEETVTFTDPETGDPIATVAFSTLEDAEQSAASGSRDPASLALLHSADGTEWTVQNLSKVIGGRGSVEELLVMEGRVVLATRSLDDDPSPGVPPAIAVWVGLD